MFRSRLGEIDPIRNLSGYAPQWVLQIGFGIACFALAFVTREFVDLFTRGAGPFSLIFPTIMISTLYGRWPSGLVTFILAFLHAWYIVLPFEHSFLFENAQDQARTIVNGTAALIILFLAEVFRAALRRKAFELDKELEKQHSLMRELEHRTKNNFAMVSSLLSMQRRKSNSEEVQQALITAAGRVQSFASIHETIYTSIRYSDSISLSDYLKPLIGQLERGLFQDRQVRIELKCGPGEVPRDRALAFGLIINELVTNAAKHAFPDNQKGLISVAYESKPNSPWCLTIADDGCGYDRSKPKSSDDQGSGLGKLLLEGFVISAGGEMVLGSCEKGTCIKVVEKNLDL